MLGRLLISLTCLVALTACAEGKPKPEIGFSGPELDFLADLGTPDGQKKATVSVGDAICRIHEAVDNPARRDRLIYEGSHLTPEELRPIEDAALEHLC